jgi:hypothetical protein
MKYLNNLFFLFLVLSSFSLLVSCGKKGVPTLKSYEQPDSPLKLSAIHRENKIILQWDFPKEKEASIAEFIIMKATGKEFVKISHIDGTKRSYTDSDFKTGSTYSYYIISQSPKGVYSKESNIIEVSPMNTPAPPGKLSFKVEDNSSVISWEKTGNDVLYNIYKRDEKSAYGLKPINKSPLSDNSFQDPFDINKTTYYTVRGLSKSEVRDEGPQSEELVINPSEFIPSIPKDFKYFISVDSVYLLWRESDETWITGYKIYRKIEGQDYVLIGRTQIPTFLDKEQAITKRDYRISAVGPVKEGPAAEIKGLIFVPEK